MRTNTRMQVVILSAVLAAAAVVPREAAKEVQAHIDLPDAQSPVTFTLQELPNQKGLRPVEESSAEASQARTKVQGYLEVPTDQETEESDRQAFGEILTGVQEWFYENVGATFETGDIQFVTRPEILQFPQTTEDFFVQEPILPRVGRFVANNGLGEACDRSVNRTDFLLIGLIGWRDQNRGTLVPIPDHNLRFAGPCLGDDGLGAAYFSEDHLDSMPKDEAVRRFVLDIAIASTLGDASAPTLAEFNADPQFTPQQIDQLRNSPLFSRRNPDWQPAEVAPEAIHLYVPVNLVAFAGKECMPVEKAVQSLIEQGVLVSVWAFDTKSGKWKAYKPELPATSDLRELCPLQGIWVIVSQEADWETGS